MAEGKTKQEKARDQIRDWQDSNAGRYILPLIVAVAGIWFILTVFFG